MPRLKLTRLPAWEGRGERHTFWGDLLTRIRILSLEAEDLGVLGRVEDEEQARSKEAFHGVERVLVGLASLGRRLWPTEMERERPRSRHSIRSGPERDEILSGRERADLERAKKMDG